LIRVKKKSRWHTLFGKGSPGAYTIDGEEDVVLRLERGQAYTFDIYAPAHTFYFSTDPVGGPGTPSPIPKLKTIPGGYGTVGLRVAGGGGGVAGSLSEVRDLELQYPGEVLRTPITYLVPVSHEEAPNTFYYQCGLHPYMGGRVKLNDPSTIGCTLCGSANPSRLCTGCKSAAYCSRDCQKKAWATGHRQLCHFAK